MQEPASLCAITLRKYGPIYMTQSYRQNSAQSSTLDPSAQAPATLTTQTKKQIARAYGALPLSFEANRGQATDDTDFIARGNGYSMLLKSTGATIKRKVTKPRSGEMFI